MELLGLRRDVPALMASADAVALLSEAEALPMTVLEAMAAARPVVVSDIGGTSEAVVQGETGLLVPAGRRRRGRPRPWRSWPAIASGPVRWARPGACASASASTATRWSSATAGPCEGRPVTAEADLLLVSLGTTLRLAGGRPPLPRAGASGPGSRRPPYRCASAGAGRLRRGYPVNDLVEMHAARRALRAALRRHRPRAVVFSTTTAAMLAPRLELPYAVRLDAPAAPEPPRPPERAAATARERRALGRARLVLPWSVAAAEALPVGAAEAVVVPPPVTTSGPLEDEREPLAVAYVPDPKAKGLDLVVAGWASARGRRPAWRSSGSTATGPLHLRRTGVPEPDGVGLARHRLRGGVPRRAPAGARAGGGRTLGGLRPGAAGGARRRRAAGHRPVRRAVRGAAAGPRPRAGAGGR